MSTWVIIDLKVRESAFKEGEAMTNYIISFPFSFDFTNEFHHFCFFLC